MDTKSYAAGRKKGFSVGTGGAGELRFVTVAYGAGVLLTIPRLLGSASSLSLVSSGTHANLSLDAAPGAASAAAPIPHGTQQPLMVAETLGGTTKIRPFALYCPPAAPAAPTLTKYSVGNGLIRYTVAPGADNGMPITAYRLYIGLDANALALYGPVVPDSGGIITANGLTNGLTYFARLTAINAIGESAQSLTVSGSPVDFDVSVMPDLYPVAQTAVAPAVAVGDPVFVDMMGAGIQIKSNVSGTPDPTKMSVTITRYGYDTSATRVAYSETLYGRGLLRMPWPDLTTPLQMVAGRYVIVLSGQIHDTDVVTSVDLAAGYLPGLGAQSFGAADRLDLQNGNTGYAYQAPVSGLVNPPYERIDSAGLLVELAVGDAYARNLSTIAAADLWVEDSAGNAGPVTRVIGMSRSQYTPASGYVTPQDTPAPVYAGVVYATGLTDGAGRLHYTIYPWAGPAYHSKDSPTETWPTPNHPSDGLPVAIDLAGRHSPIYAWVNQDGTVGASAAVQAGATDPGTAGSYATVAAACVAIKTYNNANRGHSDLSGGVIMLRNVAGSTAGANAGAYSTRGAAFSNAATYPSGLVPLEIRAASGAASQLCRWRGVISDGTTITLSNKGVANKIRWKNIYFDGVGLTGTDYIAVDGTAAGAPTTKPTNAACVVQIFDGCTEMGNSAAGSSPLLYRCGLRYILRGRVTYGGAQNSAETLGGSNIYGGLVSCIGSSVAFGGNTTVIYPRLLMGSYVRGVQIKSTPASFANKPITQDYILLSNEVHIHASVGSALSFANPGDRNVNGLWAANMLVRMSGTSSTPLYKISADGSRIQIRRYIEQHLDVVGQRKNGLYNDQGYYPTPKTGVVHYSNYHNLNNKRDTFGAPETPASSNDGTYSAATAYTQGMILYDGSSAYYQAKQDAPAGTSLTNPAYWFAIPTSLNGTAFGQQPRRLGAMRYACGVGSRGACVQLTANTGGDATPGPTSWAAEVPWIDSAYNVTLSYAHDTSALGSNAETDDGDYTPATGAPQLNRVRAGAAVLPFDLHGRARRNDGTGASGCRERAG